MTKKQLRKDILPIVCISFQDHSASLEGIAEPYQFIAVGIVIHEDAMGYRLAHWYQRSEYNDRSEDVCTYIAKVRGLSIKTVGHIKVTK